MTVASGGCWLLKLNYQIHAGMSGRLVPWNLEKLLIRLLVILKKLRKQDLTYPNFDYLYMWLISTWPIIYLLTNEKEINVLVSSQVDRAQREDIVTQATNEPDGPHCARACGHSPRAKQIQDRMLLFHLWGLCLCDLQQRFAVLRCLRIQEFLHLQSVVEAIEAGHGVQKSLHLLVTPRGDQVERRLGKHPADQQEWGGAEGEDDLVDPPHPHQITGESHHHDADCKEGMDVHGGPRAHLAAGELCHIDKHHHEVATGYLQKKDRKGKESKRTWGGTGRLIKGQFHIV